MSLATQSTHPGHRAYVVKLNRDAAPPVQTLSGRVEHLDSGEHADFASADELVHWLTRHASTRADAGAPT